MRLACQSLTIIIGFTFEKTFKSDIQQSNNPHRPTLLKPMAEWAVVFVVVLRFYRLYQQRSPALESMGLEIVIFAL